LLNAPLVEPLRLIFLRIDKSAENGFAAILAEKSLQHSTLQQAQRFNILL